MLWENIKLIFWEGSGNLKAYAAFLNTWYELVKSWLEFPLIQFDVDQAHITIVDLWAWERNIERFNSEPEWLYRRRVKHAYQNARDAGTVIGFKRIWERMELGYLELDERLEGRDWDIVELTVTESTIAEQPELLDIIIEKYGRTGRRYEWTTKINLKMNLLTAYVEQETENITAKI
jgi:hypothetical protein